jgi:predicted amidohydrolase
MKKNIVIALWLLLLSYAWAQERKEVQNKYQSVPQSINRIRVASVSVLPDRWDKETNWRRLQELVIQASRQGGAQLVVTPEGVLDGYVINDVNGEKDNIHKQALVKQFFSLAEPLDGSYIQQARKLADTLNIFLVMGFLEKAGSLCYNAAILLDPDGDVIGHYRKTHFAQGYRINPDFYKPGNEFPVFNTPFGKVGILICYDRQFPEPARILALKGAQMLLVPSYGSYTDDHGWNTTLMRTRAYENSMPVVFCNPYQSLIISDKGDVKAEGGAGQIVYAELATATQRYEKRFENRRPGLYHELFSPDDPAK